MEKGIHLPLLLFTLVRSGQPFARHRRQKRDKNSGPALDCLHGGIPHLVIRIGLHHVWLRHHAGLCGGCGYSPTLQLYHHDWVQKKLRNGTVTEFREKTLINVL